MKEERDVILLPNGHEISLADFYYLNVTNGRCAVYEAGSDPYICPLPIKSAVSIIEPYPYLILVNPSTIVNSKMVDTIRQEGLLIQMKNGHYIKVDKGKREELIARFREREK